MKERDSKGSKTMDTMTETGTEIETDNLNSSNGLDGANGLDGVDRLLTEYGVRLPMYHQQLSQYLPHAYPFILIDRVTDCVPFDRITGFKNVTINEPFFTGHFPNNPIMPGVLMIEAMAQLSGILGFISDKQTLDDGYMYLFAGVDKVRFRRQVVPGDQLVLKSCHVMQKRQVYKYHCQGYVEEQLAVSAELTLMKQVKHSTSG